MADAQSARDRLCDPAAEVSAHWLIDEAGRIEALVPETQRAWHAGAGTWLREADVNSRSIGIELANPGDRPFPAQQMESLCRLLRRIMVRWQIPVEGVIAHSDLAPGRKIDPGPRFDWEGLAREGLAVFERALPADPALPIGAALDGLGYPDVDPATRLHAFRLRHRPWGRGPESEDDRRLAHRLVQRSARFPAEPEAASGRAPT